DRLHDFAVAVHHLLPSGEGFDGPRLADPALDDAAIQQARVFGISRTRLAERADVADLKLAGHQLTHLLEVRREALAPVGRRRWIRTLVDLPVEIPVAINLGPHEHVVDEEPIARGIRLVVLIDIELRDPLDRVETRRIALRVGADVDAVVRRPDRRRHTRAA